MSIMEVNGYLLTKIQSEIVTILERKGPTPIGVIANLIKRRKQTAEYHLSFMEDVNIVKSRYVRKTTTRNVRKVYRRYTND